MLRKITKPMAKKLWDNGKSVFLLPCKLHPNNLWQKPCEVAAAGFPEGFDAVCNIYSYYNCDKERGKYLHYYVETVKKN